ncbi:MAG: M12 family metallo-peptidase [Ferruginibacter sp.]
MKKIYLFSLFIVSLLFSTVVSAQKNFFSDIAESAISIGSGKRVTVPQKFRTTQMDYEAIKSFLATVPDKSVMITNAQRAQAPVLILPMPDGSSARFRVWEASIQEPELQAKFPEIRTYTGQGIDDPFATIRFDLNPYFGFHGQILSAKTGSIYIDPYARGNIQYYQSYYKKDFFKQTNFHCLTPDEPSLLSRDGEPTTEAGPCRGTEMRTYRLAIACTGGYSQSVAGGAAAPTHAAVVTSANRVIQVYEVEVAISFVLVANNNLIEYIPSGPQPLSNTISGTLLTQNQTNTDAVIGFANYDFGHVFTSDDNGLAQLSAICGSGKARGATGSPVLVGDPFDIDYVAHEMGHQSGAPHTFNSNTCASTGGSYEPGGGTTIMAYAGICAAAENIQPNSDAIFHPNSFDAISNFQTGSASGCGVASATGNTLPVITTMSNNNISIPISTPFTLTATATDADGDAISYNWDGWDIGAAGTWPTAAASTTRPLFRTRLSKTVGSRTFPDPRVIAANYPGTAAPSAMDGLRGEVLPTVARTMKFRLTVRDNRAGGGGVVSGGDGCQLVPIFQVNVVGSAAFAVTVPNGGESYAGGTTQNVTWNVSGTDATPISTSNVRILFSSDGGLTFPTVLVASTANDGSEPVVMPVTPTTTARIKVEAIGNIFFDISNNNFTITQPVNGFTFNTTTPGAATCGTTAAPTVSLGTTVVGTFTTPIVLAATAGVPAGTTVSFSPTPLTPGSSSTVTLNNANTLANGTYTITITGTAGATVQTTTVSFVVSGGSAPTVTTPPANVTVCAPTTATFTVTPGATPVTSYQWQVNTGSGFTNITGATTASYTTAATTGTMNGYQYRVVLNGQCGTTNSAAATLTVNTPPTVTTAPANTTVCAGTNAVFSVVATGTNLTYQWQVNTGSGFTDISGATGTSYTVTGVTLAQSGTQYQVIISGTCGTPVTSGPATLSVGNSAAITGQPANLTVCVGANASFTVAATGSSLTYQWQVNTGSGFTDITGATTPTLNLGAATAAQNGYQYRVNVFSCSPTPIVSNTATLTVNSPAAITTQPSNAVLCQGANASFTVVATGTAISYQWQQSVSGCAGTFTNITGATSATYTVNAVTPAQSGYAYRVVITNSCNSVTSSCVTLTVNTPIVVTTQPASTSVCLPTTTASFSVVVTGTTPTYQWQVNTGSGFTNITGATSATLNLTGLTAAMNGYQYRVVIAGTCTSSFNSNTATLTVNSPVNITDQPDDLSICEGLNGAFSVAATGSTITYQWQVSRNGGPFVNVVNDATYAGATTATLSLTNVTAGLNGNRYRVIVSGVPCGSVNSNTVSITVNANPGLVLVAAEYNNLTPYTPSGLYSTVSPAGTYTYTWYQDGSVVPNQSGSSITPLTVDWFGEYQVLATDANGCSKLSNLVKISDSASKMIFIYPNPSNGIFQVRYYSTTQTEFSLNVYDSKGARVWSKKYPINARYEQMLVDLGRNASGTYLVEVKAANGNRLAAGKAVIQR